VREAVAVLAERGIVADYMRIRAFPFGETSRSSWPRTIAIFVVEQNRDAQLESLLTLETAVAKEKLHSILVYGGFPLSAGTWSTGVTSQLERS
jgi:2-oxoglutarate ferredoxin oxidoreductase subunit alpha